MADVMKGLYYAELRKRVDAWEGKKTEDFQYEPERAELKAAMYEWLAAKLEGADENEIKKANRKYFGICMAELVYEDKVRPNIDDFINFNKAR